jgi:hypothetical protein
VAQQPLVQSLAAVQIAWQRLSLLMHAAPSGCVFPDWQH